MGEDGHLGDRQLDCRGSNCAEQTLHPRGTQVASAAGARVPRATSWSDATGATSIVLSVAASCGSHPWCSALSRTPAVLFGERRAVLSEHLRATPGALRRCPESEPEVRRAEWGLAGGSSSDLACGGAAVEKPGLAADQACRDWEVLCHHVLAEMRGLGVGAASYSTEQTVKLAAFNHLNQGCSQSSTGGLLLAPVLPRTFRRPGWAQGAGPWSLCCSAHPESWVRSAGSTLLPQHSLLAQLSRRGGPIHRPSSLRGCSHAARASSVLPSSRGAVTGLG